MSLSSDCPGSRSRAQTPEVQEEVGSQWTAHFFEGRLLKELLDQAFKRDRNSPLASEEAGDVPLLGVL